MYIIIIVSDIWLKTRCLGLHFGRRMFRLTYIFNHLYAMLPEATEFSEITQKGHYAVK